MDSVARSHRGPPRGGTLAHMKRTPLRAAVALVMTFAAVAPDAEARPRPQGGKRFESNKTFGLETMCVGGGQGMAMIVERLS